MQIGRTCFLYNNNNNSNVTKAHEYILGNVVNAGLPLPLIDDGKSICSPMIIVDGGWSIPNSGSAALCLSSDGKLSWVSTISHSANYTYMGFLAYAAKS